MKDRPVSVREEIIVFTQKASSEISGVQKALFQCGTYGETSLIFFANHPCAIVCAIAEHQRRCSVKNICQGLKMDSQCE